MDNPFLALFEGPLPTKMDSTDPKPDRSPKKTDLTSEVSRRLQRVNEIIENTFLFTINPYGLLGRQANDPVKSLIFLQSIAEEVESEEKGRTWLDVDVVGRALFERILMSSSDISKSVLFKDPSSGKKSASHHVVEPKAVAYLSECYFRLRHEQKKELRAENSPVSENDFETLKTEILQNVATAFAEPELYPGQDLCHQLYVVVTAENSYISDFLTETMDLLTNDGKREMAVHVIHSVLVELTKEILQAAPLTLGGDHVKQVLQNIARSPAAAEIFILYNFPKGAHGPNEGRTYGQTLLGIMLTKSCLPEHELGTYEFFDRPSKEPASVHSNTERSIWMSLEALRFDIHQLFNSLLRSSPKVKHLTLMWLGDCFKANAGRGKLWTSEMGALLSNSYVSDGFFLNLGDILLRLCNPFCQGPNNVNILKVDPTYIAQSCVVNEDSQTKNVHLREGDKETCLLPREPVDGDDSATVRSDPYNFITDIFFLAHKSQDLGFRVCHEKFMKLNQELGRQQQIYRDLQLSGSNPEATEAVQKRMEALMQRYLSLKAALLVPTHLQNMMYLSAATSTWMIQMALRSDEKPSLKLLPLQFPIDHKKISPVLKFIPEFVMENVVEHILLGKRFCPQHLEEQGEYLGQIFELILMFMGSRTWVKNPHLRAKLAECLEALLPKADQQGMVANASVFNREQLFLGHPHRLEVVSTLLHVFVDIEMTGQAVAFEMKFSYRRPMYEIMKYLWEMEDYKKKFLHLAEYAELHINDEDAPLFLRFVNLLINDAIYLLDEALGYMKQIQQFQEQQPSWQQLPQDERQTNENQYHHTGRLARYHNIMGLETIQVLDKLTSEIRFVFLHPTMVDRIAAMLNYFLKNLVGPERKSFKVKNLEEYSFRPGDVVTDISRIYINFAECNSFLSAVSRDGRSYSPGLFSQAEEVLIRIGRAELIPSLRDVAEKVGQSAESLKAEEEMFSDAPDHFLDPIMSHLMRDPVKLPTSGQIVDRSTIARHLLSDQSDPFTRAPLTMDMVIPQVELKAEIDLWIANKKSEN